MRFESEIMSSIIYQIQHNSGKNIYKNSVDGNMSFNCFTEDVIKKYTGELKLLWQTDRMKSIIDNTVDAVLKEFYSTNQYIDFNAEAKVLLKRIYNLLFQEIIFNNGLDLQVVQ